MLWHAVVRSLHALALAAWLAATFGAGLGAAILFPLMKTLAPHVPEYARYSGEHWRLAAGIPANRLFEVSNVVSIASAAVALATLMPMVVASRRARLGRAWVTVEAVLVVAAAAVLAHHAVVRFPRMQEHWRDFVAAAHAGNNDDAGDAQRAFDADHPGASRVLSAMALLLAGAVALHAGRPSASASGASASSPGESR